jgi:glycosyltransferase involved in cell wall biosynthesis
MKIAFLLESFKGGGVERNTLILSGLLADRGHDVLLATCRRDGPLAGDMDRRVRYHLLEPGTLLAGRLLAVKADPGGLPKLLLPVLLAMQPPKPLRHLKSLADFLAREQPHAVFAATPHINLLAIWARKLAGVNSRIILGERIQISHYLGERSGWRYRRLLPLIGRSYPAADGIIAVSNGVADELAFSAGLDRSAITTVYNPVVVPSLEEKAGQPIDHPWFRPGEPPVILSAGRLSDQKDYPTLLRAFARVHEQTPVRLMILGDGGNPKKTAKRQEALMRQASELGIAHEIELPGFISNPYPLMSRAGVFVLSSTYEGLPTVLIEAMACGCPVVSTDYPGAVEILDHGTWGRLARVGDPASLARAIQETLDASRNPEQLWLRARDFSGERAADAYEQLITGDIDQAVSDDPVRARTPHPLRAGSGERT